MSIDISEFPEFNWPLVAALGVVAILAAWIIYKVFALEGQTGTTDTLAAANGAASEVLDSATGVIKQLTGQGISSADQGTSFWTGVGNFISTGSIYGNQ